MDCIENRQGLTSSRRKTTDTNRPAAHSVLKPVADRQPSRIQMDPLSSTVPRLFFADQLSLLAALIPGWRRYCVESDDPFAAVTHRAAYYLTDCDSATPVSTVHKIAEALLSALDHDEPTSSEAFGHPSSLLAQRILARFGEVELS